MNAMERSGKGEDPLQESGLEGSNSPRKNIINFFFELGMLKRTPRSGFQFLGTGRESVADHSFRVAMIGYTLARLEEGIDPLKLILLCLFHDLPEARTGDMNYVNKRYVSVDENKAISHLAETLPFGADFKALMAEYRSGESKEAELAHDADQLELILSLKEENDLGNSYARKWIEFAKLRLKTDAAKELAEEILKTDSTAWWFEGHDHWWQKSEQ